MKQVGVVRVVLSAELAVSVAAQAYSQTGHVFIAAAVQPRVPCQWWHWQHKLLLLLLSLLVPRSKSIFLFPRLAHHFHQVI